MKTLFILMLLVTDVYAVSARRFPGEDFRTAARRNIVYRTSTGHSAYESARYLFELKFDNVPEWKERKTLTQNFKYIRDLMFLDDPEMKGEKRRSSWFYPDDGCWIRAQLVNENLRKKKIDPVAKIFIFGNLTVQTKFSPEGSVSWWYHVVPLVKVENEIYAIDPAIKGKEALPLKEWILKQVDDVTLPILAICHPDTFSPGDDCENPETPSDVENEQGYFLTAERERLKELKLDLKLYLGKNPPWH